MELSINPNIGKYALIIFNISLTLPTDCRHCRGDTSDGSGCMIFIHIQSGAAEQRELSSPSH